MNELDLLIKAETEGLDTLEEALTLADFVWSSGLHRSTGSWGRFLQVMNAEHGWTPPEGGKRYRPNDIAENGVTRCPCGCKYWSADRCTDCGLSADDDLVKGDD